MKTKITLQKNLSKITVLSFLMAILTSSSIANCTASYTYSVSTGYGVVTFTNNTTVAAGGIPVYVWDFGDGSSYNYETHPQHTYSVTGTYTVCLSVYDSLDNTCNSTFCDTIYVSAQIIMGIKHYQSGNNLLKCFPNPFTSYTDITYSVDKPAIVEMVVYDLLGNTVEILEKETKQGGTYIRSWETNNTAEGIYILQLKINGENIRSQKLVITR
jgi:PKD repeat protein